METEEQYFSQKRDDAKKLYLSQKDIYNPYFKSKIVLNSDGFHHLQFSARRERSKREQLYKFKLLELGLEIIKKSATIQEYRKTLSPIGKKSSVDGSVSMKEVEYWGLVAIIGNKNQKIRTVVRRVGNGNITFWSVMLYSKIKNGNQKLYSEGIDEE